MKRKGFQKQIPLLEAQHEEEECNISVQSLPQEISLETAIEVAYHDDIQWIEGKLRQGVSVLVACDRDLTDFLLKNIKVHLEKKEQEILYMDISAIEMLQVSAVQDIHAWIEEKLQKYTYARQKKSILAIPNLDLFLESVEQKALMDIYSIVTLLSKFPQVTLMGFHEHGFSLPTKLSSFFCAKKEIFGMPRNSLSKLVRKQEAEKWNLKHLNMVRFHKYVSGLNPLQLRKTLEYISSLQEEDAMDSPNIYNQLRDIHRSCGFDLPCISFERDVAGQAEIKKILQEEIIQPFHKRDELNYISEVKAIEQVIPKGMLFSGPSGTGKLYIARALASSLDAVATIISCPELKMKWEDEGKSYIQNIFYKARHCSPSMIIFDKLDALAAAQSYQSSGLEYTILKELVRQMDHIQKEEMVFIVGITSVLSTLDPALLRPGRFELHIPFSYPNRQERKEIMELYKNKFSLPLTQVQIDEITQVTSSYLTMENGIKFSADHLYALCRFLHRKVTLGNQKCISRKDIQEALGKIAKYENKGELSQEDKWRISIHEAGHCIISQLLGMTEHIPSVSIIAEDIYFPDYNSVDTGYKKAILSKETLYDRICLQLAGKIAEEAILNDTSTLCMLDLEQSTNIARDMVEIYGMGTHTESINYRKIRTNKKSTDHPRYLSLRSQNTIDSEVQNIISTQYKRCQKMVKENVEILRILSSFLLDITTLDKKQLEDFFAKHSLKTADL
ncbi:MAG: AAA family ATPase [Candidatus Brocadiae bacterium]|nr:AAA family ATPase [Candidatus Brocadiia bacterium]